MIKEWPYSIGYGGYGLEYGGDDIKEYDDLKRSTKNVNSLWET
jgi:hypothetical protein